MIALAMVSPDLLLAAEFDWYWLVMVAAMALIGIVFGGIVLLVVWMTGGLHDA